MSSQACQDICHRTEEEENALTWCDWWKNVPRSVCAPLKVIGIMWRETQLLFSTELGADV
jgi:hypothetical protein